jgi:hypothetical protein
MNAWDSIQNTLNWIEENPSEVSTIVRRRKGS